MNKQELKELGSDISSVMECFKYSGRYMYGQQCLGIRCENPVTVVLDILKELISDNVSEDVDQLLLYLDDVLEELKEAQFDSLGMDYVVYFPNIPWDESFEECQ